MQITTSLWMSDILLGSLYCIPANSKRGKHGSSSSIIVDRSAISKEWVSGSFSKFQSWEKLCSWVAESDPLPLPVTWSRISPILQMIKSLFMWPASVGYLYESLLSFGRQVRRSWDNFSELFGRNRFVSGSFSACQSWEKDADWNWGSIPSMWFSRAWAMPSSSLSGKTFLA